MKKDMEFKVTGDTALLPFLLSSLSSKSRNNVKGILKRGQVSVDGKKCTDHAKMLKTGQVVAVLQAAPEPAIKPPVPIIYEDDYLIVVDKPSGMLSMSTDKISDGTAYNLLFDYVRGKDKSKRVFIVHRLDRETSGIILFAKNEKIKLELQENWDTAVKYRGYTAIVEGAITPPQGTIKSWLLETKTHLMYSSKTKDDGKLAITNYRTVKTNDEYSMLEVSLETGRKNQIRVHMNDMGAPVVGDKKYGATTNPLQRLGLHASTLTITHPVTREEITWKAKLPKGFAKLFEG